MTTRLTKLGSALLTGLVLIPASALWAQDTGEAEDEDVFDLNPFIVEAPDSRTYTIDETLAGTRIRTDMRDLAASISTVSEYFLRDTASTGQEDLLVFTANTEVGGLEGNFSNLGAATSGYSEDLVAPHTTTRVRGLTAADNTRNYFRTDIPWDSYNTSAVTIQRGPNSVLFGVAGPAGVINASIQQAVFDDNYSFTNLIDEFGRIRNVLDLNEELIDDELAVRFIGLDDDEEYRQKQAYKDTKRYYGAVTYQPRLLGENQAPLNIAITGETGEIRSNAPRTIPPRDYISPFFDSNKLNRLTIHPQAAWAYGFILDRGTRVNNDYPQNWSPWLGQQIPDGGGSNMTAIIDNVSGELQGYRMINPWQIAGVGPDGSTDANINGFEGMIRLANVAGFNEYSQNINAIEPGTYPGATTFWKDTVLDDPRIFDFYNNILDGDNKNEWTDFDAYNASISQTFWHNRLGLEFFYDYQELTRGGINYYSNVISLDVNTHYFTGDSTGMMLAPLYAGWPEATPTPGEGEDPILPEFVQPGSDQGVANPNVGRAFVSGGRNNVNEYNSERENFRWTGYVDLDSRDFLDEDSLLTWLIGRHTVTGLYQEEEVKLRNRTWRPFASSTGWTDNFLTMDPSLAAYNRAVPYMLYISDDLSSANVADGLGIQPVSGRFSPSGEVSVGYFDGTWTATDVDPGAEWIRPRDGSVMTQSENPANYGGWKTGFFDILNAEKGDIDSLYVSGNKSIEKIDSQGITWQGRLFGGLVIPTVGYREDEVTKFSAVAPKVDQATAVVDPFFDLKSTEDNTIIVEGEMTTWGVVVRSPKQINDNLPIIDNFTLFYNESENISAESRVGFDAQQLPLPSGSSEDYGFTISALDGRVNLKATWYETAQTNATISGGNPLGNNSWYLANQYAWGILHAVNMEAYHRGENIGGKEWYYNYAWPDDNYAYDANVLPPEGFDHPSLAPQEAMWEAVYARLLPQEWFDAYGYPFDVAKLQSSDWETRKQGVTDPNYRPGTGNNPVALQPAGGGTVAGQWPIGTVDQQSEGFELELSAQITPNWNVYVNASKVKSVRGDIGENFTEFLGFMRDYYDSPAGDIRQWWAGDRGASGYFDDFIWGPYLFQQEAKGLQAPEIRPWRFNVVTNYEFTDGALEGFRVGLGYRWEDDLIVGNELNDAEDNLDPNRPIYGGSQDHLDIWVGYSRQLTERITWDIQLNVKSVGDDEELVPVSVNPDGQVAVWRIQEGMRWELRNTFSF